MNNKGFLLFDVLILIIILTIIITMIYPLFDSLLMNISNNNIEDSAYKLASELQLKLEDVMLNKAKQDYYNIDLDYIATTMRDDNFKITEIINYKNNNYQLNLNSKIYNDNLIRVNFEINYNGENYEEYTYFMERQ